MGGWENFVSEIFYPILPACRVGICKRDYPSAAAQSLPPSGRARPNERYATASTVAARRCCSLSLQRGKYFVAKLNHVGKPRGISLPRSLSVSLSLTIAAAG